MVSAGAIVIVAALALVSLAGAGESPNFIGGYVLLNGPEGLAKMQLLAENAATLPITRLFLGFFNPTLTYYPNSNTLNTTGLNLTSAADGGFASLKASIAQIKAGGVQTIISMGGWDFNCFGYLYTRYSVGGYGTSTPNFWKIQANCDGNVDNASPENEWCYTCEPQSAGEGLGDFAMFPEPGWSDTWNEAVKYITAAGGNPQYPPVWDTSMVPGLSWTDPKTNIKVKVPGLPTYHKAQRDPYQDIVYLARDLGADGIDIDYEEDWHADYYKYGPAGGPWVSPQTVYKVGAIVKDVLINIEAIQPNLMISMAAGAAGAWAGNWWGGNLKGIWLNMNQYYPDLMSYVSSTGGINVMTYDLSDNEQYYECPETSACTLDQQVAFYMNTYTNATIPAAIGYEIGTPAYPDPVHDPENQLPLTFTELGLITTNSQPSYTAGFFWEMFRTPSTAQEVSPTQVAQAICNVVMPGSSRCNGTIPTYP